MGIYIIFISWGNSLGPLAAGFVINGKVQHAYAVEGLSDYEAGAGWRWYLWVCTMFTAVNFLMVLFLVPETRFYRNMDLGMQEDAASNDVSEKMAPDSSYHDVDPESRSSSVAQSQGVQKSYLQTLKLWSGVPTGSNIFQIFLRPFPLIAYPAVFWAFMACKLFIRNPTMSAYQLTPLLGKDSISLAAVIFGSTLCSFVLAAPPYNFSTAIIGLINIPAMSMDFMVLN